MTLSKEELEKRVAVLERKAEREKKARNLAENQLEKYSLDIYEANQSLKSALASATQKQSELAFLAQTSSNVASEVSLGEMISNIVALTGTLCSACCGAYITSEHGKEVKGKSADVWHLDVSWQANDEFRKAIHSTLPIAESKVLDTWAILDLGANCVEKHTEFTSLFYTNFALSGEKIGWLVFLTKTKVFEPELLSVLNTSREHVLSGIRRRLTDVRILKRNVQLQDSLNKLEKARRQLIQSEKMASLGQLAAGVAHEINNPIAFIRSNMEVLNDYLADFKLFHKELKSTLDKNETLDAALFESISQSMDLTYIEEDSKDILQSNLEGLERVKGIVDNLKGFSHAGDETLVEMSLDACISAALKIAGNLFKYEHKIDNKMSNACPKILGNLGQLQQVFVNLFVNAAQAMETAGQLTIDYSENEKRVVIHIKDTGCGMDEETLKQLFTPFFTTKPVGEGTGLGLSVSYAILEAHGAEVVVDSELNVGTTFNLSFAIAEQ
ncbi:MAG: ATP-binding protein [Paraglaciecola sp.]|uniref:sensor histidine kinase n=1 Tax=Paraglaciecola sp. TaxID=1920173 RepID=UPI0032974C55